MHSLLAKDPPGWRASFGSSLGCDSEDGQAGEGSETGRQVVPLEQAYRAYAEPVWRFLARMGVDGDELEDAVHDVFLIVHRKSAEFSGRSSYRTWIFGIAFNIARQRNGQRASLQRRRVASTDLTQLPAPVDGPRSTDPQYQAERSCAIELLDRILAELDRGKREVFVLYEIEGFDAAEISRMTGTKRFTVYSRLRAARRAFDAGLARQQSQLRGPGDEGA